MGLSNRSLQINVTSEITKWQTLDQPVDVEADEEGSGEGGEVEDVVEEGEEGVESLRTRNGFQ